MSLDPYQLCPCGSGKKIKFCCSKDMVAELEKVIRAVEGEQRVAALDQINRLIEDKGDRTALLALKADVQLAQGDQKGAEKTIVALQKSSPHNPVALSLGAILAASQGEVRIAVEKLQEALESTEKVITAPVYSAIGVVATALLNAGDILAARGHWLMQAGMAGDRDPQPAEQLMRINLTPEIPLLLKDDSSYAECPAGVPWRGEFNAAINSARKGTWLAACESLESLAQKAAGRPAILKNMAILRGWLGQTSLAVQHWRAYSRLDQVPLDEAVEAEALAQMLDPDTPAEEIDQVSVSYPARDTAQLMEVLLSDKRIAKMPVDPAEFASGDEPPPKGVFWLLDRPTDVPDPIRRDNIPTILGEICLFGKQTTRDARLEFATTKTAGFADKTAALTRVVGDLIGDPAEEKKLGSVSAITEVLTWQWHMPQNIDREMQLQLIREQQEEVVLTRWTKLPLNVLGGKTPAEAATDPDLRRPLLAAILLLELASESAIQQFDYNLLRRKLDLPAVDSIDAQGNEVMRVSLVRLAKINAEKLDDQDLVNAFQRSVLTGHRTAIYKFGSVVLRRDGIDRLIQKLDVYEPVIRSCPDTDQALAYVDEARQLAVKSNNSPAKWLLTELSLRIPRMEPEKCERIVRTLQERHMKEPGVGETLYKILVGFGLITPEGQPAGGSAAEAQEARPPEQAKLWTPEDGEPASGEAPAEKKLWVPGMD